MNATVKQEMPDQNLGTVAMCEYILSGLIGWEHDPAVVFQRPDAFAQVKSSLKAFKDAGGNTLVDCSGMLSRDGEFLTDLAAATGVAIVASTGLSHREALPGHFLKARGVRDAQYLAELFYQDLTRGLALSGMRRSSAKAGIVRAAGNWDQLEQIEELALRGAAMAAKQAGAPLVIIGSINQAWQQMKIALEEGLNPDRIIMGHGDDGRAIDLERDKELAGTGVSVAYDHIGWEDKAFPHALPDERRVELVKAMVDAGFADRLILSCSAVGYAIGAPPSPHSFSYLLTNFVPRLKKAGVGEDALRTILRENPKRLLAGRISNPLEGYR